MSEFALHDINVIEGEDAESDGDYTSYYLSIQRAINSGMWGLQGSYGRAMMDAITSGYCMLGKNASSDYYGNRIPSRDEVKAGTKGSREYVVNHNGEVWAAMMEEA